MRVHHAVGGGEQLPSLHLALLHAFGEPEMEALLDNHLGLLFSSHKREPLADLALVRQLGPGSKLTYTSMHVAQDDMLFVLSSLRPNA
jgi:hypothetical protein